jgi:hypothetical protein
MRFETSAWVLVILCGSRICRGSRGSRRTFLSTAINLLCESIYLEIVVMFL